MQLTQLPSLDSIDVAGKRVLIRADLNVPMKDGVITDDFRIRASAETFETLLNRGARLIICSHLGRPKGHQPNKSLAPVAKRLQDQLSAPLSFCPSIGTSEDLAASRVLKDGQALLVENLRFDDRETNNDEGFAAVIAKLGDIYVNDAFGASHRAHASIVGVTRYLPSFAGPLLCAEVENLSRLVEGADHPFVVVLGGAKVSDKLPMVSNLLDKADLICIGGGMCFTFLAARGIDVAASLVDQTLLDDVKPFASHPKVMLPVDVVVADSPDATTAKVVDVTEIPQGSMGLDIGPKTAANFAAEASKAKRVFWNGPMGVFENPTFANGSKVVAEAVIQSQFSVTGGGDTQAAMNKFQLGEFVTFASTGGGASLEFLQGAELPGLAALKGREEQPTKEI